MIACQRIIIIIYGEYKTPDSYVNAFVMKGITNMQMLRHIFLKRKIICKETIQTKFYP